MFVHITGFGTSGAGRDHGAYDGIIQAMSGVPWLTGAPGGPPVFVPGWMNRVMVRFLTAVPRRLGVLAAGKGMRDAIRRSRGTVEPVEGSPRGRT